MRNKLFPFSLLLYFWAFFLMSAPSYAGITFNQNQVEIVLAPTCNHVPVSLSYTPSDASYDESLITVSSDSDWALPSVNTALDRIEISFATDALTASYTATISVDDGATVTELFIHATVPPLDIYRLLDDPLRSKTYGIQRNGIYKGSIIVFDPIQESITSCITVGESPTDFVINGDSTELLVINSVGKSIDVIDLATFSHKETINLPVYDAWGNPGETTANIDLGPDDIIYYTDGSWAPVLHVLKRSTDTVVQSILFNSSYGFMDFAVTSDKTKMVAMPQYGWSAGAHSPIIGQFTINGDGTVNIAKQTTLSTFSREPFEAPVLMRDDDQIAVMKTISTDPANTDNLDRIFPSAIWSMNPNGSVVATGDKLYEYDTGKELYTIPGGSISGSGYLYTKAQAFTSDFTRFIYFNSSARTLNVVNLINEIGLDLLGRSLSPKNGAVVNSPDTLTWAPLSGVDQYDLYLGTDNGSIAAADQTSPYYLGRITGTSYALLQTLVNGTDYFWRIDPVTALGPETGTVYTFTVSEIALDVNEIDAQTVTVHSNYQVDIQLTSDQPGISWTASAADPWVTFTKSAGSTPSTLRVHLNATMLSSGLHNSMITLTSGSGELQIPVQLKVDPLFVTHIRSDRNSAMAYAISEDTSSVIPQAYLLEIDSAAEKVQRVIPVGSSVTDFTINYADNLVYVTNWKSGNLLAIDKSTFEHTKSMVFQPAASGTCCWNGDVYRVAAGVSQRLVVEEKDQWIDISIYDTNTEATLATAFVREGGGAFGPAGRYYYHGENNSSGASIVKFDTIGDTFTQVNSVRPPEISSYYGSRTVVVSEDGSRIFWAGVALDQNLTTEWGIGDIIYSTSTDGRYAFAGSAIYDVNLRRQVLTMPTGTTVSGYNSTSNKLIVQVGGELKFYPFTTPLSLPAPTITASNPTYNSVDLGWTDDSLEMQFLLQQRVAGTSTWTDIGTTAANVTSWTATNLQDGPTYEFRVRASSPDYSSPWSNIASATLLQKPVADNANFSTHFNKSLQGSLTGTGSQGASLQFGVYQQPQYGFVTVNTQTGDFTYVPSGTYSGSVDFQFYVNDGSVNSNPATVIIELTNTAPQGEDSNQMVHWQGLQTFNLIGNDADGDAIRFEIVQAPIVGALTLLNSQTGEVSYVNDSPSAANTYFTYRVSDGADTSSLHRVDIQLTDTIPVAPAFEFETFVDIPLATMLEASDADGDKLTYELLGSVSTGQISLSESGLFSYTAIETASHIATVPYRVSDGHAWSDSGEITLLIHGDSAADYSPIYFDEFLADKYAGAAAHEVNFTVSALGGSGSYHYLWDFGDGSTSSEQKPGHTFVLPGEYTVKLSVTDQNDITNIASGELKILVLADYSPVYFDEFLADKYAGIAAHKVNFTVSALGGSGNYDYLWDFGDGSTSSAEQKPGHTFVLPGKYTVRLTVTDQNDSANIASGELKILALSEPSELSVDFTSSADVGSQQAVFNVSIDGDQSPYTLEIDYGDGNTEFATVTSNLHTFKHNYAEFGSYTVSVNVTSQSGAGLQQLSIASGVLTLKVASNSSGGGGGGTSLFVLLMLCLMSLYRNRYILTDGNVPDRARVDEPRHDENI